MDQGLDRLGAGGPASAIFLSCLQGRNVGWVRLGGGEVFEPRCIPEVVPYHLLALPSAPDLDRHALRSQDVFSVLVAGHHVDLSGLVELGNIMDSALPGAVTAHVVDDATPGDDHSVAALFHTLDVAQSRVVRLGQIVDQNFDRTPIAVRSGASTGAGSVQPARTGAGHLVQPPGGV